MTCCLAHAFPLTALLSQHQLASACARLCAVKQRARPQSWASGMLCSAAEPVSRHHPSLQQVQCSLGAPLVALPCEGYERTTCS